MATMRSPQPEGPAADPGARRPATVLGGALLSYVGSALLFVDGLISAPALLPVRPPGVPEGPRFESGHLVLYLVAAVPLAFAIAWFVLAIFAQQKRNGARVALSIVVVIELALSMPTDGPGPEFFTQSAYAGVVLALFWMPRSNDWYRRR